VLTFSIVVPHLNQSHFLPWALESLRVQSWPYTLAVMDGGSVDNFTECIQNYDNIINYLQSCDDGGQANAIKIGKKIINGDIVAWLNADDYYFPETLSKVASCFQNNPWVDVVYGDAVHVTSEGNFISYFPAIQEYNQKTLFRRCFICQPACFVRRKAYEKAGEIDSGLRYTMDWDLWCRLAETGAKFLYLNEPLAAIRYYQGTKTLSGSRRRYWEIWRIERKYARRVLPWSWPGFYKFDLQFRDKKTFYEKYAFAFLNYLSETKRFLSGKYFLNKRYCMPLYGFDPFRDSVDRKCTIHLPWYGKRAWKRLYLGITPLDKNCDVMINGKTFPYSTIAENLIVVPLPMIKMPHITITIEQPEHASPWKLKKFEIDVAQ